MASNEVRIVDPASGGEKGSKPERHDLIPPEFLTALARLYGEGVKKYADRNWERGYDWSLSYAAMQRHLVDKWLQGEDIDSETGANHLINAIWHLIALYIFQIRNLGTDNLRLKRKGGCLGDQTKEEWQTFLEGLRKGETISWMEQNIIR